MGKTYYIDGENVGKTWLKLDLEFAKDDQVYVFCTNSSQALSQKEIDDIEGIVENINIKAKGHNDLDILIAGCIGASIGKCNNIVIVSNDTGYGSFIDYFTRTYMCNIERVHIPDTYSHFGKIKKCIKKMDIDEDKKKHIIELITHYRYNRNAKKNIYNNLCRTYGHIEGRLIYNTIKKYIGH